MSNAKPEKLINASAFGKSLTYPVSRGTVHNWIRTGHLKAYNHGVGPNARWMVPVSEVDRVNAMHSTPFNADK